MLIDSILTRLIRQGRLTLRHPDGTRHVIQGSAPGPEAALAINTPEAAWRLVWNPSLGFGEGYMDGGIEPIDGSTSTTSSTS